MLIVSMRAFWVCRETFQSRSWFRSDSHSSLPWVGLRIDRHDEGRKETSIAGGLRGRADFVYNTVREWVEGAAQARTGSGGRKVIAEGERMLIVTAAACWCCGGGIGGTAAAAAAAAAAINTAVS